MKKLVFATNNLHKLSEARSIVGSKLQILSLSDIGCTEELPETGNTLAENAIQKACYVRDHYGVDCFADDTGLMVDALEGAPGVYTARFAGPDCLPADNIRLLLQKLEGVADRRAVFATVVALATTEGGVSTWRGEVEGDIALRCRGDSGFGYDPVFIPRETGISFAAMTAEAKNQISHRGRAMRRFLHDILS